VERLACGRLRQRAAPPCRFAPGRATHYSDTTQLTRGEVEDHLSTVPSTFAGENVIYAVRGEAGEIIGFTWVVLFDPGTGLEGEVAEVYVAAEHRGRAWRDADGASGAPLSRAPGDAWLCLDPPDKRGRGAPVQVRRLRPNRQLVLTWYPTEANRA